MKLIVVVQLKNSTSVKLVEERAEEYKNHSVIYKKENKFFIDFTIGLTYIENFIFDFIDISDEIIIGNYDSKI